VEGIDAGSADPAFLQALSPLAVASQSSSSAKMPQRRPQELFTVGDAPHVDCTLPKRLFVWTPPVNMHDKKSGRK
jgi:hypothetical protein